MRVLWAPWRLGYVSAADRVEGCIFCDKPAAADPETLRADLVLHVDPQAVVMLNRFPYANGHLMVAPREHTADFAGLAPEPLARIHRLLAHSVRALEQEYNPRGFNLGLNLGRCAGAGFADHLHWHVVPRWQGDTNFMPVLADTKVMPEHLEETYQRLSRHFPCKD